MSDAPKAERRLELVALDELKRAERNPKLHAGFEIQASLRRFGYAADMIGIDERTGAIAGGHGRLDALLALRAAGKPAPAGVEVVEGVWMVPVVRGWASADDAEADAYRVATYGTALAGGVDEAALSAMLADLATEHRLDGTGFTALDVDRLLADSSRPPVADPDEAAPVPSAKAVRTAEGDVWTVGRHRLAVGDNRSSDLLARLMDGGGRCIVAADAVFTDPPYGVEYEGKTADRLRVPGDDLHGAELAHYVHDGLAVALAFTRRGGAWFVCSPSGPDLMTFAVVLERLGVWRQTIVWAKDAFVQGRSDYPYAHEFVLAGEAPDVVEFEAAEPPVEEWQPVFYGWRPGARHRVPSNRTAGTVWRIPRPKASKDHPTMKPVALVERAITGTTQAGAVILDVYAGSGTTGVACERTGRVARLVERDPGYAHSILRRLQAATGSTPVNQAGKAVDFT